MILVTTHQGADFDSYAGVLAASLLHPGAVASFPGAKEPALRSFLESCPEASMPEVRVKDVNLDAVRTLVLVDTVSSERIGPFAALLEPPGRVQVICYDHHPQATPPAGAELHVRAVGAVTTLLSSILRDRGIVPTQSQATLLALGIYEDTGGLLHAGTTADDLKAVAWLVERGADLGRVARTLFRGLTALQVDLYHELLHSARSLTLRGREVTVASVATGVFVPDASVVVQQYVQTTGIQRFAGLFRMEDRIFLIVRSRSRDLDASRVAAIFGGGGHATAAAAVVHGKTLIEAQDALLSSLEEILVPAVRAMDLMTPVLYRVDADASVESAVRLLNRYRINALPVIADGEVSGALTRQIADVALQHGMGGRPVRDLVVAGVDVVPPDAHLETIRQSLLSGNLRFVLVGSGPREIRGIITRATLLHYLYEDRARGTGTPSEAAEEEALSGENLSSLLEKALPRETLGVLRSIEAAAAARGLKAYLVGGVVRDLLLHRETRDLDVVVEGDACAFGRELVATLGGTIRVHEAFQTAALFLPGGTRLDLASARTEHYRVPAALPEVSPGGIRQDLFRRDFTINALAVQLTAPHFGRLLDFFGSRRDLRQGKIRVMHGVSFIEDPTRAFRAVRFATQLGFGISRETAHLIRVATEERVFERVSPVRLRREVEQLLGGRRPVAAVQLLAEHRLLGALHPQLKPSRRCYARLERAEEALSWHRLSFPEQKIADWVVALCVLAEGMEPSARCEILDRLRPGRTAARILREGPEIVHRILRGLALRRSLPASLVVETCHGEPVEALLLCMALAGREEVRRALAEYLSRLRDVRPDITGKELIRAGVPQGPRVALGLRAALHAKLDGRAPDGAAQLRAALAALAQGEES